MIDFDGQVVVLTGSTGQVGRALIKDFRDCGATVVGLDINPVDAGENEGITVLDVDVGDRECVKEALRIIQNDIGTPSVIVNNAGIAVFTPSYERTEDQLDEVYRVNLKGVFNCIVEFSELHRSDDPDQWRNIVNVASLYGMVSPDPRIYVDLARNSSEIYGATKAGVIQMTKYFSIHLAPKKIRVNCVSPGGVFNPSSPQGSEFVKAYGSKCPMGRLADVSEVTKGVIFLASETASYINGHNLVIDGGFSSW